MSSYNNALNPIPSLPFIVCCAQDALRQENYSAASQIQGELKSLDAQDAVSCIRRQLEQALAQERYADAAQLRDAGLSGLAGWWAGQAEDDPVGHLLHITPEYSR